MDHILRNIPAVHDILECKPLRSCILDMGRESIKCIAVQGIQLFRDQVLMSTMDTSRYKTKEAILEWIIDYVHQSLQDDKHKRIKRIINGTGIPLHTNMGRAPLPQVALERISEIAGGYSNLEYDIRTGKRGSRYDTVESLLKGLTGAESAMVVNNNAAAVFIALNTLAMNHEVIISRSEQVEIGGSFRIPDIIRRSGATMVEVGTTNKTYRRDYEEAITDDTSILLKVHKSNYRIEGFTEEVLGEAIGQLARDHGIVAMEDLGSGCLLNMEDYGLPHEPTVMECVKKGMDVITFSGDKLLGGPQAGIIVGRQDLINQMKKNPLTRMVRIDKLSLIALESVLQLYIDHTAEDSLPIMKMMKRDIPQLETMAVKLKCSLEDALGEAIQVQMIHEENSVGGGALPGAVQESVALTVSSPFITAIDMQTALRLLDIPIVVRIKDDYVILSMRTLLEQDYACIVEGFCHVCSGEVSR